VLSAQQAGHHFILSIMISSSGLDIVGIEVGR
jgi:hypothetical protein